MYHRMYDIQNTTDHLCDKVHHNRSVRYTVLEELHTPDESRALSCMEWKVQRLCQNNIKHRSRPWM